jgi:YspA, cpYpsA-related SLOG family
MKIAIVGSRAYPNEAQVRAYVRSLPADTVIVSGGARGVDRWAEDEARRCGMAVRIFPADWKQYGTQAGFIRNRDIIAAADKVVAFHYRASRGTAHSILLARAAGKPVEVWGVNDG